MPPVSWPALSKQEVLERAFGWATSSPSPTTRSCCGCRAYAACSPCRSWTPPSRGCPTAQSGQPTSNTRRRRVSARRRSAWSRGSCGRGGPSACGATSWGRARPSTPPPTPCLSPTSRRPSWGASGSWAGRSRPGCSTCTPSSAPLTNGARSLPAGSGLLGALTYFGLPGMAADAKDAMRDLILTRSSWDHGRAGGDPRLLRGRRAGAGAPAAQAAAARAPTRTRQPARRPAARAIHVRRSPPWSTPGCP